LQSDAAMPGRPASATTAAGTTTHSVRDSPHAGLRLQYHRWKLLAPLEKVPSLLDGSGHLFTTGAKVQLLARGRLDEVELELRWQIETVLATGLTPTHLDWHALADGGRDDIFDLGLLWLRSTDWPLECGYNAGDGWRGNRAFR
jgi:YdjC-like protein